MKLNKSIIVSSFLVDIYIYRERCIYIDIYRYVCIWSLSNFFSVSCQNVMPLSAGLFKSEKKNPVSQCPPRLHVQFLTPVLWSRVSNHFLKVTVSYYSSALLLQTRDTNLPPANSCRVCTLSALHKHLI